ncbi:TPA: hypothetical protein U5E40_001345 [Yersinia enterocolitica]|nr:hypothetical protein [Yersinia enterocolitica]
MCQSARENVNATSENTEINHEANKTPVNKRTFLFSNLVNFANGTIRFIFGVIMTLLNIIARVLILMPVISFWLVVFVYFDEGIGNIGLYFELILSVSLFVSVLFVLIDVVFCIIFKRQCRLIY